MPRARRQPRLTTPGVTDRAASDPAPPVGGIARDPIDVRDRSYEPTLAPLAPRKDPPQELIRVLQDPDNRWRLPRLQGNEGTCGGQALAALIDLERIHARVANPYPASARMIYECARLRSDERCGEEGVSLRNVIKAFYNYGVCDETLWPYEPSVDPGRLSVERARDARNLSLGAYYRLRPNLNTYHAALHETGALLVSAELHDGWHHEAVRRNKGEIVPPRPGQSRGALGDERHAFVIVGYNAHGFLVLNSWGKDWGGWTPETPPGSPPVPGLALWRYEDWADTIMDGWVLRLGACGAESFDYSVGDQGLGFGADGAVRATTPVHAILGNFLHLDDGDFAHSGTYVSTEHTLDETLRLLKEDAKRPKPYRGALLTFAGGLVGLKDAAEQVARWKRLVRDQRWYPLTLLWCVDYVEQVHTVLDGVFREAEALAGRPGDRLDRVVEERAHGVGRALWRDIGCAAERAVRPDGPLHLLARAGADLAEARPDFRLRIIAESEGAIALAAFIRAMRSEPYAAQAGAFFTMLESVDLVAPPMTSEEYTALAHALDVGWGEDHPRRRIRVHLPTARDERRLAVPPYGLSYFELVRRAFHRRDGATLPLPGFACSPRRRAAIADKWSAWNGQAPRSDLVPIAWAQHAPPTTQGPLTQIQLLYRSDVGGRLKLILRR